MYYQETSIDLFYDTGWKDFVRSRGDGLGEDLILCASEAQTIFDVPVGTQNIRVHVSNRRRTEVDLVVSAGRNGHVYYKNGNHDLTYKRSYVYTPTQEMIDEWLEEWDTDTLFVSVEVLEDER